MFQLKVINIPKLSSKHSVKKTCGNHRQRDVIRINVTSEHVNKMSVTI